MVLGLCIPEARLDVILPTLSWTLFLQSVFLNLSQME